MTDFAKIAKSFSYVELCYLEDALENFKPNYPVDEEMVKKLKETITASRGWAHYVNKTERDDSKK